MNTYIKTVKIDRKKERAINDALNWRIGDSEDSRLGEDDCIFETVRFDNGIEADIKCCGVSFDELEEPNNCAYTEIVFFKNGCEVSSPSDISDSFLGKWEGEVDGDRYIVNVEKE